jgi:hypothetical protein
MARSSEEVSMKTRVLFVALSAVIAGSQMLMTMPMLGWVAIQS